jgi:hypothetical protein
VVGKLATRGEIGDEQLAAIKNTDSSLAGLHEKICRPKQRKSRPAAPTTSMSVNTTASKSAVYGWCGS